MHPNASSLETIIYSSHAEDDVDEADLLAILQQARDNNARNDITGLLLYRQRRFLQVLEGSHEALASLMQTIATDPRHTSVRVLVREPEQTRHFAAWAMGFAAVDHTTDDIPGFQRTFDALDDEEDDEIGHIRELTRWFRESPELIH